MHSQPSPASDGHDGGTLTRVVIVAKTRMGAASCIGGLVESTGQAIRPLPVGGFCHPADPKFHIGEVWDMSLRPRPSLEAPHIEDHDAWNAHKVRTVPDLPGLIKQMARPWTVAAKLLFDGTLRWRRTGTGYIPRGGPLPKSSVGFWVLPQPLLLEAHEGRSHYLSVKGFRIKVPYVGFEEPVFRLPAGTLVRVSLARWWNNLHDPSEGETCSLQLSGWFGLAGAKPATPPNTPSVAAAPPAPVPKLDDDNYPF